MRSITSLGVLALVAGACFSTDPDVVPFRGGVRPASIAVLAIEADDLPGVLRDELDVRAHGAVASRGYEVIPVSVTERMLLTVGAARPTALDRDALEFLRSEYRLDSVLVRRGRVQREARDPLEGFVVQWDVIDTVNGVTIWSAEQNGGSRRDTQYALQGQSPYTDDPLMSDEPMVHRTTGSWVTEVPPLTMEEIVDAVQLALAARMPRYEDQHE